MTTNGATLRHIAHDLRQAGLNRLNISLDTLDRAKFEQMTRRDELRQRARRHRRRPGRRASTRSRSTPSSSAASTTTRSSPSPRSGASRGVEVRFIEFMPLDASDAWQRATVVGQDEIVAAIAAEWPLEQVPARGAAPADRWRYLDGAGVVGVIPTVTKPFCGDCDRVRLTADGQFRTCLFATDEFDLRELAAERRVRCRYRGMHRGRRGHQVGGAPDQPGQLHPPRPQHEPDRRVSRRAAVVAVLGGRARDR